ncbi:ATP-binding protein [uncultured Thiodictyon sp.]|uniref:ATP-binding protein n=1 Tax=uncultured Thiodictyon sp. TaxID=1846217 RepID=UPI0025EADCD4|nr:ATP-binding protein [uncultured Thiodictyon sp.]
MALSIRAKLFLTLLLACLLVVIGTHAFVRWSLQQGLIELADAREGERIAEIAERLTMVYAQDGGWEALRTDPRRWVAILIGHELGRDAVLGREPGPGGAAEGPRRNRPPPWVRHALAEPGVWPPRSALDHLRERERPPPIELRLMLLDAAGVVIYGQSDRLAGARRRPLELDGHPIGSLAILPGPPLTDLPEIEFQSRQGSRLWIIALGMLLVSAALASPLSRWLVRPVRRIQEATRRLAAGDFSARVTVQGRDELARLGRNLNALAATLEGNEQARRRWVADIAHELRTPISLLRAELEAMQDGVRPLNRAGVDALHADVLRLGRLVGDLHELSVTDLGALSYRMVETDLRELLAADLDAFRPRFVAAGLRLELDDRAPGPVILSADLDRLSQAIRNLLGNSLKYTDAGGGLTVRLDAAPGQVTLDFQDTAPGCPPESLPRLFDRLYRVEGSRSRQTGGAGLGLAIVKNVIEAHGGAIRAAAAPAGGLWIHIELPT